MAQFCLYENPNKAKRALYPYLLDIQSDLLRDLRSTVVIPLCPASQGNNSAITKLCPQLQIGEHSYIAMTPQLAGIDRQTLGAPLYDLSQQRSEIIAALDFLITGI